MLLVNRRWVTARQLPLQLTVAALMLSLAGADFNVHVNGPDDVNFKDSFGYVSFPIMKEILSVTSPLPNLLLGDESTSPKNRVAFRGSLPNCGLPFTVIGRDESGNIVTYKGKIDVKQASSSDLGSSVVVTGKDDAIKKLVDELKATYDVSVVSNTVISTAGETSRAAIVLRDKSGKVIPRDEAEKIIKEKLKDGLAVERPECYSTCKTYCDTVLVQDASRGFTEPGKVKNPTATSFVGLPTKWEYRCGKDAFKDPTRICGSDTCGKVGKCKKSFDDPSYGVCESCTPATVKNEERGPNCEVLTRSYLGTSDRSIVTHHRVPDDSSQPESFTLSFRFAGKCQKGDDEMCSVLSVESAGRKLAEAQLGRVTEPMYTTATLPSMPRDSTKTELRSERFVQQGMWMDVTVVARLDGSKLKTVTVFCTIEPNAECVQRTAESSLSGKLSLKDTMVKLGGSFDGCFRNVRLNGRLVDLKLDGISGEKTQTSETCSQQDATCGSASNYLCGDKSVCYGFLGADRKDLCRCKCFSQTRQTNEKVTAPSTCAASCSKQQPIITTKGSNSLISWEMKNGAKIPLQTPSLFSLSFRFRTRVADASDLLQIECAASGANNLGVKLDSETLKFCIDSTCYGFVPKVVNDGYWHEAQASLAQSQLVTRIDNHAQVHVISTEILVSEFKVKMNLPSSCITGLRVMDIYMPTGEGDPTKDDDSAAIKVTLSNTDVTIGSKCSDPSPACNCNAATETCEGIWGDKKCVCRPGYRRSGGSCAAPTDNPCTRLSLRCPNSGGKCVKVGNKWQVCQ